MGHGKNKGKATKIKEKRAQKRKKEELAVTKAPYRRLVK